MTESSPIQEFWQETRSKIMVRGDGWKPVVEDLPNHISAADAKEFVQKADQLTVLTGQGHIGGILVQTQLNKGLVLPYLNNSDLTLENIVLQWLYRFYIIEAVCEHNRREPLQSWFPVFLHTLEQGLHFLLYMAALLVLLEENKVNAIPVSENLHEDLVKARVAQACEFLHPKAQDYGESFRRHGLPGLLPRLWDKIARYVTLKADNRDGNFEKREDSARDLLGYCCIAYSLMLELPEEFRKSYQPTSVYETDSNVMAGAEWKKTK